MTYILLYQLIPLHNKLFFFGSGQGLVGVRRIKVVAPVFHIFITNFDQKRFTSDINFGSFDLFIRNEQS